MNTLMQKLNKDALQLSFFVTLAGVLLMIAAFFIPYVPVSPENISF